MLYVVEGKRELQESLRSRNRSFIRVKKSKDTLSIKDRVLYFFGLEDSEDLAAPSTEDEDEDKPLTKEVKFNLSSEETRLFGGD